jgi:hypothetical protein
MGPQVPLSAFGCVRNLRILQTAQRDRPDQVARPGCAASPLALACSESAGTSTQKRSTGSPPCITDVPIRSARNGRGASYSFCAHIKPEDERSAWRIVQFLCAHQA